MFGVGDGGPGAVCRMCSGLAVIYMYVYMCIVGFGRGWPWLGPCSGVSVTDFGQVNTGWVLVILMIRFLLTNVIVV